MCISGEVSTYQAVIEGLYFLHANFPEDQPHEREQFGPQDGGNSDPHEGERPQPQEGTRQRARGLGADARTEKRKKMRGKKEAVFLPGVSAFASVCVSACPPVSVSGCPGRVGLVPVGLGAPGQVFLAGPCLWGRTLHRCRRQPEDWPSYAGYLLQRPRSAAPNRWCGSGKQGGEDVAASQLPSVAAAAELGDGPPPFSGMIWSLLVCDCRAKSIVRMPRHVLGLRIVVRAGSLESVARFVWALTADCLLGSFTPNSTQLVTSSVGDRRDDKGCARQAQE